MKAQQATRNRRNSPQQPATSDLWADTATPGNNPYGVVVDPSVAAVPPSIEAPEPVAPRQAWSGVVRLDEDDRLRAEQCADRMLKNAARHGYEDRFGDESWGSHVIGALGEIAFAKYLGVDWACHTGDIGGAPDVRGYEVRAIPSDGKWVYLKAKPRDRLTTRVVLVLLLHRNTAALIVGWMTVEEIRTHGKYRDPGRRGAGAWFVEDLTLLHTVVIKGLRSS